MRISTLNSTSNALDSLGDRQARLAKAQQQLTSGKRVERASDDPAAAARAERALAAERRSVAEQRAVDASGTAMALTESALGDAGELLQQAREALVAAGNPTYGDAERNGLANRLAGLRDQLLAVANRSDAAGSHLFGGQGADHAPFADRPGGVQYDGSAGSTQAASADALPLAIDGAVGWMNARTGNGVFETRATTSNGGAWIDSGRVTDPAALTGDDLRIAFSVAGGATTYSVLRNGAPTAVVNVAFRPGQSIAIDGMAATIHGAPADGDAFDLVPSTPGLGVFDALDRAIAELKTPGRSAAGIAQGNATHLANLDAVAGQLAAERSRVGATLNRIDAATERLAAQQLASQTERSNAADLDMTQAISDFASQQTGYEAALKAYSMVQRLSLFDYLNR